MESVVGGSLECNHFFALVRCSLDRADSVSSCPPLDREQGVYSVEFVAEIVFVTKYACGSRTGTFFSSSRAELVEADSWFEKNERRSSEPRTEDVNWSEFSGDFAN